MPQDDQNLTRRMVLGKLGLGAAAAAFLPAVVHADAPISPTPAPALDIDSLPYDEQLLLESYRIIRHEDQRFRIVHAANFMALCEIHGVADGVTIGAAYDMEHLEKRSEMFHVAEEVTGGFLGTSGGPQASPWEVEDLTRRMIGDLVRRS